MSRPTHALLLTAGAGTRLRPLSDVRAKPAIPVAGEPMIRRIIRWLVAQGVTNLVLNLHHRPETLTAVVGDGSDLGAHVRYSWEQPTVLGSAGGPRQALDIIGVDRFFIVNGDVLTDASLEPLVEAHSRTGALVTMAMVPHLEFLKYGGVQVAADGSVTGLVARGPEAQGSLHFIGPQLVQRDAFASVRAGEVAQTLRGLYDRLIAERPGSVRAVIFATARYWDIGAVADYWRTSKAFSTDSAAGASPGQIAGSARVTDSILWDDVTIGEHAIVDRCIVTDGVRVPANAVYRQAVLTRTAEGRLQAQTFEVE